MRFKVAILCCCLVLISACASKSNAVKPNSGALPSGIAKIINSKHERINELLSFIETYSNLTADAQKKTYTQINLSLAENKNNFIQRAKLAIMLSIPTSRLRDAAKAQVMLQELLRDESLDSQENDLLGLLYEYAQDDVKQQQRAREEAKKLDAAQQKLEALQQKNDSLEQKLNDLKKIEKTMNDRTKTDNKP